MDYQAPSMLLMELAIGSLLETAHFELFFARCCFDGSRQNFGDLHVTGQLRIGRGKLAANWHIEVLNPAGDLLVDFGEATSQGIRLR